MNSSKQQRQNNSNGDGNDNDPIAQYYLHISDEVNAQMATDRGRAENMILPSQSNASSTASSGPLRPFYFPNHNSKFTSSKTKEKEEQEAEEDDVEKVRKEAALTMKSQSVDSVSVVEEQRGDFVHVQLEHLPTESQERSREEGEEQVLHADIAQSSSNEQSKANKNKKGKKKFSFYRKFASEGASASGSKGGILSALSSSFGGNTDVEDPPTTGKRSHDAPESTTKNKNKNSKSNNNNTSNKSKSKSKSSNSTSNSKKSPKPLTRVQALQGPIVAAASALSKKKTTESISPLQSLHSMPTESNTSNHIDLLDDTNEDSDICTTNPNSQKYLQRNQTNPSINQWDAQATDPNGQYIQNMYSKSLTTDIGTSKSCEEDSDDASYMLTKVNNRASFRAQLKSRQHPKNHRLSLWQTIQHNTRANFCSVFLLGVALCCLVLLVVAKLTNTSELLFYDEESDSSVIVSDNEMLLTVELLALALILVLLLGSAVYCGVATCDSNRALIKQVKHKDACLANAGPRRKYHPHYDDVEANQTMSSLEEGHPYQNMNDNTCCSTASLEESPSYNRYVSPTYYNHSDIYVDDETQLQRQKRQTLKGRPPRPTRRSTTTTTRTVPSYTEDDYQSEEATDTEFVTEYEETDYDSNDDSQESTDTDTDTDTNTNIDDSKHEQDRMRAKQWKKARTRTTRTRSEKGKRNKF